ncbi:hypothetical protein [Hoeflea sp.]|uniref:hypothetical protein n=1 Tax=Hoeflea sp. TaxID=1940281 RepID=UPI003BAFCC84
MSEFLSDHLKATRDVLKGHAHGGKTFSADEIVGLVEHLDELARLAIAMENDLSRYRWNDLARRERPVEPQAAPADNVIMFTCVRRERLGPGNTGGGGAA